VGYDWDVRLMMNDISLQTIERARQFLGGGGTTENILAYASGRLVVTDATFSYRHLLLLDLFVPPSHVALVAAVPPLSLPSSVSRNGVRL